MLSDTLPSNEHCPAEFGMHAELVAPTKAVGLAISAGIVKSGICEVVVTVDSSEQGNGLVVTYPPVVLSLAPLLLNK